MGHFANVFEANISIKIRQHFLNTDLITICFNTDKIITIVLYIFFSLAKNRLCCQLCLSVCKQHDSKGNKQIVMKFYGWVWVG